jgi:hypothetical protein
MKRNIQIFDNRPHDRVIGILCENDAIAGVIVNITFVQGEFDEYTTKSVVENLMDKKPDVHLLEIYKRLTLQYTKLSTEEALERACELYVIAFIVQEII